MADRFVLLLFLVMWLLCFTCPGMGQDAVVCRETYFVERHSEATISCEYDPSFYTVRWYFGGSEVSILLIDDGRRSGSGFDSGEYDITDEGAMIIKGADAKHEGTYKITVLDRSGKGTSKTMKVYVTVPITTLTIENCGSSSSPLCTDINGVRTYLVCDVHNFWPSVTLHWLHVSENGSTPVPASTHATSFDNTTSLFSSKSTLLYTPDLFSFQYFTCFASGNAAHQVSNKSIEVEGNIQVQEMTPTESHLEIGADLIIPCPINDLPFGKLQVKYPQTNYKVIKIIASCTDDNTCGKNGRREVVIENVHYKDEGLYQCISSDGKTAVQQETNMIITVSPEIPNIIIKECKDAEECPRHSDTTGSVSCSISGFRPPMYLSIETNNIEMTLDQIEETITEDESTGTSTTSVLYAYEVPECSESVVLTCISVPDQYRRSSIQADLSLNSESDKCSSSGGGSAVVIVVIVVIILVIAATVSGIFIYKKVFAGRNKQRDETEIPELDEGKPFLPHTVTHDEISNSGKEATETLRKSKKEKKVETLFDQKMKNHVEGKKQHENIRDLLDEFQSEYQVDPYPLFKSFVEHKQIDDEVTLYLVKEVVASGRNEWLSSPKVLELLDITFARKQLPFRDRLKIVNEMYLQKQINVTEYSLETLSNFEIHQKKFEEVYNDLNTTKMTSQENVITTLHKCLETLLKREHSDPNDRDDRESFLMSVVLLGDDTQVIRHLLLLCVEHKSVDVNHFLLFLYDNGDKLHVKDFFQTLEKDNNWLSNETFIELLKGVKKIEIETDQFLLHRLSNLLSTKRITPAEFVSQLISSRDSTLISEEIISEQLDVWITTPKTLGDVNMEVMYHVIAQELVTRDIFIEKLVSKGERQNMTSLLLHVLTRDKDLETETTGIFHGVIKAFNLKPHEVDATLHLNDISDNDRQGFFAHKEVSETFLADAYDENSKSTPWELQSIFELGVSHDVQVNILTNKKVVEDFLEIKLDEKVVEEFKKRNMDEKSWKTIWLKLVLLNLLRALKHEQKIDKYIDPVLLGSVINNCKVKPSDIKAILDNMEVPLDERITILTDKKVTKKILDSKKGDKWKKVEWMDIILMLLNGNEELDTQLEHLTQDIMKRFKITKDDLRERMLTNQGQLPITVNEKIPETSSPADVNPHVGPESLVEDIKERTDGDTEDEKVENATSDSLVDENNDVQTDVPKEKEKDSANN